MCVYFVCPTIAIAKIRDYSQSTRSQEEAIGCQSLQHWDEWSRRKRPMSKLLSTGNYITEMMEVPTMVFVKYFHGECIHRGENSPKEAEGPTRLLPQAPQNVDRWL